MNADIKKAVDGGFLESLRATFNRREFVNPDPLQFLYDYDDVRDREVIALVASALAFGRVAQIIRSVSVVLDTLGDSPAEYLETASEKTIRRKFAGFVHRFATGMHLAELLLGVKRALKNHGSLHACFMAGFDAADENILPALTAFVGELSANGGNYLLPSPRRGSACKRLNLFLRWMVRRDEVDPGGWRGISPSKLIVPLDVHMHRIARALGLTARKQADMRTALEITDAFKRFSPGDPVRYDFCLTRLGIRNDIDRKEFIGQCCTVENEI